MTLEGCVVRISDIISYIGRDIEDAVAVRLIKRDDLPADVIGTLGTTNKEIVNALALDVIENSYDKPYVRLSEDVYGALDNLLKFNTKNIYSNPKKQIQDDKIKGMFRTLYDIFLTDLKVENTRSSIYEEFLKNLGADYQRMTDPKRIVIDYIAGMTDDFLNSEFKTHVIPQSFGRYIERRITDREYL